MIKLKIAIFLLMLLILSGSGSSLTLGDIKIDESGITGNVQFKNVSAHHYVYAYKEGNNAFISDYDYDPKSKTAGFSLSVKDSTGANAVFGMSIPFGIPPEYLMKLDKIKKEEKLKKLFLKPGLSLETVVKMPNSIGIESLKNQLTFQELLKNKSRLSVKIIYRQDSTYVKSCLSKRGLDSLKRNNIKIFHGTLESNTIIIDNRK